MSIHWHNNLELLMVLSGICDFSVNGETYPLAEGDLILTNGKTMHSCSMKENCIYILCHINLSELPLFQKRIHQEFTVNSVKYPHPGKYNRLRFLMCKLIKVQSQNDANCGTMSVIYDILSELIMNFHTTKGETSPQSTSKHAKRQTEILEYIMEHYQEGLTLQSVAEAHFLSVPYLSSFFKKNIGITFTEYYNNLRMHYAMDDLLTTDLSIEDIAHQNGFPDSRTFLRLFKEKYQMLPSVFRKKNRCNSELIPMQTGVTSVFFPSVGKSSYLPLINRYTDAESFEKNAAVAIQQIHCDTIALENPGQPLVHTFRKVCSVSSAKALLYSDIQEMLRSMQADIGYEYIYFYGLLNIDTFLYAEKPDGTPYFTFVLIDKIFDFILSINLKPIVNFSNIPYHLCNEDIKKDPNYLFRTSPPKDFDRWELLVHSLTEHLVNRYGEDVVSTWLFNTWNKPELKLFSIGDAEFRKLYQITYHAVKGISPRFRFGTPTLAYNTPTSRQWDSDFIDFCRQNHCMPDFLCFSFYSDVFTGDSSEHLYLEPHSVLNKDPDFYQRFLEDVDAFKEEKQLTDLPSYMMQWHLTVSSRNLINDTCFLSCYITKNLLENYDRMASFGYWSLTDFSEETELPADLFFGGIGLFTHNGIKKANYYAFNFASSLGDELLGRGEGWFVTRHPSSQKLSMIFYNYEHYDDVFAEGNDRDLTLTDRYRPFLQQKRVRYSLKLTGMSGSYCYIKEFFINQMHGSCYDKWSKMGGLPLKEDELQILRVTHPGTLIHTEQIDNGILFIETELDPLEIRLVEIEPRQYPS